MTGTRGPRGGPEPPPGATTWSSGRDGIQVGKRASPRRNTKQKEAQAERTRDLEGCGGNMRDSVHELAGYRR